MNPSMNTRFLVVLLALCIYGVGCATQGVVKVYETPPPSIPSSDNKLFAKALAAQNAGRVDEALKRWQRFLALHPNSFEAHNNLGLVYYTENQVSQALHEFEAAYRLEPVSEKIRKNLSRALKFQADLQYESKEYRRVIRNLKRLKEVSPPKEQQGLDIKIEKVEDAIYERVQRADTKRAYQDFIRHYPDGLNAEAARKRIQQLDSRRSETSTLDDAVPISLDSGTLGGEAAEAVRPEAEQDSIFEENVLPEPFLADIEEEEIVIEEEVFPLPVLPEALPSSEVDTLSAVQRDPDWSLNDFSSAAETLMPLPDSETLIEVEGMAISMPSHQVTPMAPEPWPEIMQEATELLEEPELLVKPEAIPDAVVLAPAVVAPEPVAASQEVEPRETAKLALSESIVRIQVDSYLNVRAVPSTQGKIVGKLNNGDERPLLGEKPHWFQIELADGLTGWVHRKFARKLNRQSLPSVDPSGFNSEDWNPRIQPVVISIFNNRHSG